MKRRAKGYCHLCVGEGFLRLSARENGSSDGRVTTKMTTFRAPCVCVAGAQWYRERCKATASGGLRDGGS